MTRVLALAAAIALATPAAAGAAPRARFLGFGLASFKSPAPGKAPPRGTVPSGGTLGACTNAAHAYLAFSGMRRGLTVTYRTAFPSYSIGDTLQPAHTFVQRFHWRFTSEVTGKPFYPAAIHLGKAFYRTAVPLDGPVRLTVSVASRRLARGRVTVASTCLPQAVFAPPAVGFDSTGFHARFDDLSIVRAPASRTWDFGDPGAGTANTSDAAHPTHTYEKAGRYTITLTVTDEQGRSDTVRHEIELRE